MFNNIFYIGSDDDAIYIIENNNNNYKPKSIE
jgi:hypothetical protein